MIYHPHPYQEHSTEHIIEHPACGLFIDMGLGKTVSTLTAIDELMFDRLEVEKVLVIAPKRVADDVWTDERDKWSHLNHIKISKVLGSESERKAALKVKAHIYTINCENVAWLVAKYGLAWPFKMVVIDESSKFKSQKAVRFKALRRIRPLIDRLVILTGTPAPNSLLDLWPQLYLLDQGERLGNTITGFRNRYFNRIQLAGTLAFKYEPFNEERIYEKIKDICISMKQEDYLTLPPLITVDVPVTLSEKASALYKDFERKQVLLFDDGEISAVNAAALTGKLLQFASGAVYDEDKNVHVFHQDKLEALEEIIEAANGKPVLVAYWFKHELSRLKKYFASYNPEVMNSTDTKNRWNEGKIQLMFIHPASAGHGLNLQAGGNIIVWFSNTWSLELKQQLDKRLYRQGQKQSVIIHRLIAKGTMDEQVIKSQAKKHSTQEVLMDAVKAVIKKYKKELV